jgi:predicted negative regulator of RcsB-dependent stress response
MTLEILSLILGPLGKILGVLGAIGGLFLWGKYYKNKADKAQARADGYQAQVEIAQGREEVQGEVAQAVEQTHERVEAGDAAGLSGDFNNLK